MADVGGLRLDRLKAIREERGFTQEEFAVQMGVEQQQVSRWETGRVHPSDQVLRKMATILNTSADYLLGLNDDAGGYVGDKPLTPQQAKLLWALEEGHITIALEAFTELTKDKQ